MRIRNTVLKERSYSAPQEPELHTGTNKALTHVEAKRSCSSGSATMAKSSVAEPKLESEPMERQLFAGAGAKVFWPGSGYVNSYKMLQKP
jgi:hypothetical protein